MTNQSSYPQIIAISAQDFAERQKDKDSPLQLIDVREPQELELARLEGFINLPLSEFSDWAPGISNRFDPTLETIVMCHHGIRSAQMCAWLMQQGFSSVKNLEGGIAAYAIRVDRQIPLY